MRPRGITRGNLDGYRIWQLLAPRFNEAAGYYPRKRISSVPDRSRVTLLQ